MRKRICIALVFVLAFVAVCVLWYPASRALGGAFAHSADGARIAEYPQTLRADVAARDGAYVPYADMPLCLVDALVSVEDKRFFSHAGIDWIAAVRVTFENFRNDHLDHGGSTITQQLAREILDISRMQPSAGAYFDSELRIARGALILEHDFSKQEILEMYLNSVYFGRGATGDAASAQAYFGVPLADLSESQCAYLAGLPQAPTAFGADPWGPETRARYLHVIATMQRNGYVSAAQAAALRQEQLFPVR